MHGDIKPSNIQIGANDEVRLLDFGIAKALTFTHSRTHLGSGQPELLLAGAIEPRASGPSRGSVGGGRDVIRNGGGRAAISGAGHAQAGGADPIATSAARAAGKLPVPMTAILQRRWRAICISAMFRRRRLKTT